MSRDAPRSPDSIAQRVPRPGAQLVSSAISLASWSRDRPATRRSAPMGTCGGTRRVRLGVLRGAFMVRAGMLPNVWQTSGGCKHILGKYHDQAAVIWRTCTLTNGNHIGVVRQTLVVFAKLS